MIIRPNLHIKNDRNDYVDTKPKNVKVLDKTQLNVESKVLLDERTKNWADLVRKVIPVLRPLINKANEKYDFETLFNNSMRDIIRTNEFKMDKNFSTILYKDDRFIQSDRYRNSTNHKIYIMTNSKGEELYICAVYTCEVKCVLQAIVDALSVCYNIEILIDYSHIERHNKQVKYLKTLIKKSSSIVFFGGAGVSTESGISDFRSKDGLYNQQYKYPPEQILSHTFFMNNTDEFYKFYKAKMNCLKYEPNITHIKLAELEDKGKLKAVITQNIDGLHQKAGSNTVYELHGSVLRNYCMNCHKFYDAEYVFNSDGVPKCSCGGIIKPDVVLYEESLNDDTIDNSIYAIQNADLLIVAGTSLTVHPSSDLLEYFKGKYLVIINRNATAEIINAQADLTIYSKLGKIFKEI